MANIIYHRCQKKGVKFSAGVNDTWIRISLSTRDKLAANVTSNQWLFTAGNNDTGRQLSAVVMSKRILGGNRIAANEIIRGLREIDLGK